MRSNRLSVGTPVHSSAGEKSFSRNRTKSSVPSSCVSAKGDISGLYIVSVSSRIRKASTPQVFAAMMAVPRAMTHMFVATPAYRSLRSQGSARAQLSVSATTARERRENPARERLRRGRAGAAVSDRVARSDASGGDNIVQRLAIVAIDQRVLLLDRDEVGLLHPCPRRRRRVAVAPTVRCVQWVLWRRRPRRSFAPLQVVLAWWFHGRQRRDPLACWVVAVHVLHGDGRVAADAVARRVHDQHARRACRCHGALNLRRDGLEALQGAGARVVVPVAPAISQRGSVGVRPEAGRRPAWHWWSVLRTTCLSARWRSVQWPPRAGPRGEPIATAAWYCPPAAASRQRRRCRRLRAHRAGSRAAGSLDGGCAGGASASSTVALPTQLRQCTRAPTRAA